MERSAPFYYSHLCGKKHDPPTAAQMPDAWELLPPVVPLEMDRKEDEDVGFLDSFRARAVRAEYPGFFVDRADNYTYLVVDDPTRH